MCHPDEDVALARGLEGANFFGYSLAHYYVFGNHAPGRTNVWDEFLAQRQEKGYSPEAVEAAREHGDRLGAKVVREADEDAGGGFFGLRGAIGTPDQVREYLRRYEDAGIDQVIFCSQAGKTQHEHIMETLELFGREILPEFQDRDDAAQAKKAARVEPMIEAAMARKPAEDHPPLPSEDYAFPAIPRGMAERMGSDDFHQWLEDFASKTSVGRGEEIHNMQDLVG